VNQQDDVVSSTDATMKAPAKSAKSAKSAKETSAAGVDHPPSYVGHGPARESGGGGGGGGGADKLIQNKLAVLACLFLVTGFLGLPLLWMNRRFSTAERFVWSLVVTIYTLALIGLVGLIVLRVYRMLVSG